MSKTLVLTKKKKPTLILTRKKAVKKPTLILTKKSYKKGRVNPRRLA